jgi:hypothetical protein
VNLLTRLLPPRWWGGAAPAGDEPLPLQFWRADLPGFRYVSENTLAVLSGESVPALHRLELFDADGRSVQVVEQRSRRPYVVLAPEPGAPALGTARVSLVLEAERLGAEAAALLRQLPAAGRACGQVRRLSDGPWRAVQPGGLASLEIGAEPPPRLHALNPTAARVALRMEASGPAGRLKAATLWLPPRAVRPLPVPVGATHLRLEAPGAPVAPLVLLEPADPAAACLLLQG